MTPPRRRPNWTGHPGEILLRSHGKPTQEVAVHQAAGIRPSNEKPEQLEVRVERRGEPDVGVGRLLDLRFETGPANCIPSAAFDLLRQTVLERPTERSTLACARKRKPVKCPSPCRSLLPPPCIDWCRCRSRNCSRTEHLIRENPSIYRRLEGSDPPASILSKDDLMLCP